MIINGKNLEPNTINYGNSKKKFSYNNYVYIPILKNAHRYTTAILSSYGFVINENVECTGKTKIIVLRDPIERWYAGIAQILYFHIPNITIDNDLLNLLTHIIVLDGHSRSQSNYLSGMNTDDCVFFNMDDENYLDTFKNYCRYTFGGKVDLNNSIFKNHNFNTRSPDYIRIKNSLKDHCSDNFKTRLVKYYQEDYDLLNTVKFYRG